MGGTDAVETSRSYEFHGIVNCDNDSKGTKTSAGFPSCFVGSRVAGRCGPTMGLGSEGMNSGNGSVNDGASKSPTALIVMGLRIKRIADDKSFKRLKGKQV